MELEDFMAPIDGGVEPVLVVVLKRLCASSCPGL
jgi:hypothetical protein